MNALYDFPKCCPLLQFPAYIFWTGIDVKDIVSLVLSAASVVISAYTFWLVQFNRGRLMMTRPTYICLRRDVGPNWPKIFIRTCLYSTGAKGMAVKNLYLRVHQPHDREFIFDFWGHTDSGRLVSDPSNPALRPSRRSRMLRPVLSETERTCKRDWSSGHPT